MGKIRLLSDQLINQIAAGEVVERPASVVKELAENALDAGARAIRIEISGGGLERILVVDDGHGMSPDDARGCLERHATSKLYDASGLERIATMGFRGEAVPAIASVSRFVLTTREPHVDGATRVTVEGGRLVSAEDAGAPVGTSVLVEDLFFNTPARRKFLRKPDTEAAHVVEAVSRLALGRPDVGFTLISNGRQVLTAPPATKDLRERVAAVLGKEVYKHLVPVDEALAGIRVSGFAASPDYSVAHTRALYTFVNRRFVRDRGLIAAAQRAYAELLPQGRQPSAVLYLEVPLEEVDVNVHPQKLEVRFSDGRRVFDAVYGALQLALSRSPWLTEGAEASEKSAAYKERIANALRAYEEREPARPMPFVARGTSEPARAAPMAAEQGAVPRGFHAALKPLGQHSKGFAVCEGSQGELLVVDLHAARERLKLDALLKAWRGDTRATQAFLFPITVELPVPEARALLADLETVRRAGFEIEPFGGASIAVKSVPPPLVGGDYRQLLADLGAALLQIGRGTPRDDAMTELFGRMACQAAGRQQQVLAQDELRALFEALDRVDFSARCPHANPVVLDFPAEELEKRAGRS